jgi:hypothetical protein
VLNDQVKFLSSSDPNAAQTGGASGPQNLTQALGGQLTNDLTNVGNFANVLKQGTALTGRLTPDISGSGYAAGQQDNTSKPDGHNWMLPDKH